MTTKMAQIPLKRTEPKRAEIAAAKRTGALYAPDHLFPEGKRKETQ